LKFSLNLRLALKKWFLRADTKSLKDVLNAQAKKYFAGWHARKYFEIRTKSVLKLTRSGAALLVLSRRFEAKFHSRIKLSS
jgi:hypothetical protein